jgi:Xaa-Pro aminopeptidase
MSELRISPAELRARQRRVLDEMGAKGFEAMVLFGSTSVFYLAGFAFIPTERPMCVVLHGGNRSLLFVPRLEVEHGGETAEVDQIVSYPEYPGETHPMKVLAGVLGDIGLAGKPLAADAAGYASGWGYRGPRLEEVMPGSKVTTFPKLIEEHRVIKSPREIELIRESCRWGNLAHALLQEYSKVGRTETEVSGQASAEATRMMIKTLGPSFEPRGGRGASAGFRGQIGPNAALPHAITKNITLQRGDVLVTGAGATVWGYNSELERTMFVEEVSPEQRKFYDWMMALQDLSFESIKPGIPCSEVDRAVRRYYDEHSLWPYWRHHVGHALGILGHEEPFFDIGDDTIIRPGMVFSVEPGLYVPGLGGFRHSDTLVVTDDGIEMLTYYPRDLASMICR